MTGPTVVWLYAVVPEADPAVLGAMTGVAAEPLRAVRASGLAAVVGSVPLGEFDEESLTARVEDPVWLESAVRSHHRVVEALTRTGTAVPLRFATLYRDDRRISRLLDERREEFAAALDRLAGRTEWGVKARLDPGAAADEPPGAEEEAAARAGRTGTAYLLHRRSAQQRRESAADRAAARAEEVHAALGGCAAAAARHPVQTAEASGQPGLMVLNGAYLVDRHRTDEFHALVGVLQGRFPELTLELTGPWPPYSFAAAAPDDTEE